MDSYLLPETDEPSDSDGDKSGKIIEEKVCFVNNSLYVIILIIYNW